MSGRRVGRVELREIREGLSGRDLAIVSQVDELRLMSGWQIQAVHFPIDAHATAATAARHCRRVLARLVGLGLLVRLPRRVGGIRAGSNGFLYGLGSIGHRLLHQDDSRLRVHVPGAAFIDHQLAVSQLVVDLIHESRLGRHELLRLQTEPECWRSVPAIGRTVVRPDLFLTVGSGEFEYLWFVEVDRGTHRAPALLTKARLYQRYYQTGIEQDEHGVFPRVVWITPTRERAAQLERLFDRAEFRDGLMAVSTIEGAIEVLTGGSR